VPYRAPRRGGVGSIPEDALSPERAPRDPLLRRDVLLEDEDGPVEVTDGYPRLLRALALTSGLNVISDFYSDPRLRWQATPIGERPLWEVITIIAEQHNAHWERQGSFLLFRNREWYVEEEAEIPDRVLQPWEALEPEPVGPAEYLEVLAELTPAQAAALPRQFSGARVHPGLIWERFLASLTPAQRERLPVGLNLKGGDVTLYQRELFQAPEPAAASLEVTVRSVGRAIVGEVQVDQRLLRFQAELPMKRRPLPRPAVRLMVPE
jgi:hypothetical protein